ncbi:sigma-70 family RNA polymerase sigma factor [Novipirellula caenicola]|uniref:RNA polymerase sigma factor n=1 Tax=Novipirellula caenicola TaxID=1536901 RepID=A0ABP9VS38_9BACT
MIDAETLSELWQQHANRLLMIARAVGEPAEDAVQEAFVALAQQSTLPDEPLAWLVRTTRNEILQVKRGKQRRAAREQVAARHRCWFVQPSEYQDQQLDGQHVTEWLEELDAADREVIVMHLWGGLTFRQIADVIGLSAATANRRYQNALTQLQARANQDQMR